MKRSGILLMIILFYQGVAAKGYQIKIRIDSAKDTSLLLAHYYLTNIYIKDTIQLNQKGEGIFTGDSLLHQGLYKIYQNQVKNFDILVGADQEFSVSGKDYTLAGLKIEGASETMEFHKYVIYLADLQLQRKALEEKKKGVSAEESVLIDKQINNLGSQIQKYWMEKEKEFPNTFFSKFLMSNYVPVPDEKSIPDSIAATDTLLTRYRYYFQRAHFFDHFDVRDERFLFTPLLKPKLETWFNQVLFPAYDSIRKPVIDMIESVKPSRRIFQYFTSFFLNASINSNIMGMDALFVDLARKYYLSGEATWADSASLARIRENVIFAENNLIGMVAPELRLESVEGEFKSLHEIPARFTLVLIYEPTCGHCKVFVPELHKDVYPLFRKKGFEVYAIYTGDKRTEWEDFIKQEGLSDWINVWDPQHRSRFKVTYDARKTPGVFLLDRDKKIVAKKLSAVQIKGILENELK